MTARTVVGSLEFPVGSGAPCVGARISAELYTGTDGTLVYGTANDRAAGSTAALTSNSGTWSLDLEPNDNITPAGTVWRITEQPPDRDATSYYIDVPDSAGPHDVTDLLTDAPGALPSQALAAHTASNAAHGATGATVGTTNTQTLTNKTLVLPVISAGVPMGTGADQTAAFTAALAAALAGDGDLRLPAGAVHLQGPFDLSGATGLTIRGAGREMTTVVMTSGGFITSSSRVRNVRIEDLKITSSVNNNTSDGVVLHDPVRCSVSDNYFTGWGGACLRMKVGIQSRVVGNYFIARTQNGVRGESAITWERHNNVPGTTMLSQGNYCGSAGTYGFYWNQSPVKSVSVNDLAEYALVGFRFEQVDPVLIAPYGEQNDLDIEFVDSNPYWTDNFGGSLDVTVAWSGQAAADRYFPILRRLSFESRQLRVSATPTTYAAITSGTGAPSHVGNIGDLYLRKDGGATTTLYVKTADDGLATGWTAK